MKKNIYTKIFLKVFLITVCIGLFVAVGLFVGTTFGLFGNMDDIDIDSLTMDYSTRIYYTASDGTERELTTLSSEQNRVWVDLEDIPENLKDAIVAIEDERFYSHKGFDMRRTTKAFFVFVKNKLTGQPTSFGGSTITQQLVKNLTKKTERTAARKILEISRAVNLEKQISKDKILELYLNSIYLSQGCNGVQTASQKFFGKPVSELNLAECASIAGITQYPSLYDPLIHPDKNKEKQELVLKKMLELGNITEDEYGEAIDFELVFTELDPDTVESGVVNSYFVDQIIYDVVDALVEKGYPKTLANKMIYSGGLKIKATIDPDVQSAMEEVFTNTDNFPYSTGDNPAQASMAVIDPYTGEIKGLVGGIGKKSGNLVLNRATQTLRQPGSTIKPIGVYAPAFENREITAADIYPDKAISYGGWTPRNYDHTYSGDVSVRTALRRSLNTVPVQILNDMGTDKSYDFMTKKLGITSLVKSETGSDGKVYSDIGLSQLALGGLTHGISALELTAAYSPFANRGIYTRPYCFVSVEDSEGRELLSNSPEQNIAVSESTAYIMSMLLREVVTSGTGGGAQISGMFTAGKTGTTSDNNDRWFVGYTPYYAAAVWYGYDTPQTIKASGNPCIPVWKKVMTKIHSGKTNQNPTKPSNVVSVEYCTVSGLAATDACRAAEEVGSFWFTRDNRPTGSCSLSHQSDEELPTDGESETDGEAPTEGEMSTEGETHTHQAPTEELNAPDQNPAA